MKLTESFKNRLMELAGVSQIETYYETLSSALDAVEGFPQELNK